VKIDYTAAEIDAYVAYLISKACGGWTPDDRRRKAAEIMERVRNPAALKDSYFAKMYSFGLYCTSEIPDSILMWSHYADNHRGFCLEFSGLGSLHPHGSPFPVSWKVEYAEERPLVDITETMRDVDTDHIVRLGLLTKSKEWAYEREWRALETTGTGVRVLPRGTLSGVVLGARMTKPDESRVRSWAGMHPTPIRLRRARLSEEHFLLELEDVA
jgi:hypothetical protein